MTERLRDHPDDMQALVAVTADALGVAPAFVEKDFWAIEVLRAVAQPRTIETKGGRAQNVVVIFKGGTSLSRVFGIINRFSEDVDVLVSFPEDTSEGSRDRALKAICANVQGHLGLPDDRCTVVASSKGVKRYVRYDYPSQSSSSTLSRGVLLEMGTRGGPHPAKRHSLRSLAANHAVETLGESEEAWAEFGPFGLEVLGPERTLLEKLAALHDAYSRAGEGQTPLLRAGRHLYDVHRLLSDEGVRSALAALGHGGIAELVADIDAHSEDAGFSYTARPDGGYAASAAFAETGPHHTIARQSFAGTQALVLGEMPSFDACCRTVRNAAGLL